MADRTAAILILLVSSQAQGAIIYDNGPPAGIGWSINGVNETLDDFSLATDSMVSSVGFYFENPAGFDAWNRDITYTLYSSVGGQPGDVIATGAGVSVSTSQTSFPPTDIDFPPFSLPIFFASFDLESTLTLATGSYWLGLSGATNSGDGSVLNGTFWVTTGPGNGINRNPEFNFEFGVGSDFAFFLSDEPVPVPEPIGLALVGTGLAAIGLLRRRRIR